MIKVEHIVEGLKSKENIVERADKVRVYIINNLTSVNDIVRFLNEFIRCCEKNSVKVDAAILDECIYMFSERVEETDRESAVVMLEELVRVNVALYLRELAQVTGSVKSGKVYLRRVENDIIIDDGKESDNDVNDSVE